ncbi:TonB-dependent receptor [candidate division KSB1 bacterium]|nr:TonB-dependent receptor [candidate division KSB1 bacterium]RQW02703.1 MAG: TonB-dependent receptor [candidate division KSB1 bacterium]
MKGHLINLLLVVVLLGLPLSAFAAGTVTGKITEVGTNEVLPGANVAVKGTRLGSASGTNGVYTISGVPSGTHTLVVSFMGYKSQEEEVTVSDGASVTVDFVLEAEVLIGKEVSILADRAQERKTPVAFSNIKKADMEARLGSRDIPLVLNVTPSVYATPGGGGAGDSRINVRGFNQRNVAIMINGVPVNDMENGWVYWSNWDGLGDASSSIQMQRGLSAVNLATPSIGGTMNILTDPTAMSSGALFKQEFGNDGFLKTTFSAATGLLNDKFAFNATIVRKTGDGLIDKTWTDAWAYYFGGAWQINKSNRLEVYAVGAPQRHGQNTYKQNIAAYSHEYAKSLSDYDPAALNKFKEASSGRLYNQNWNFISPVYFSSGQQAVGDKRFDRYSKTFLNERENFYHKPIVNLNWYSQLSSKWNLFTTAYWSGGQGGGTGTLDNQIPDPTEDNPNKTTSAFIWDTRSEPTRIADWDANIEMNKGATDRKGNPKTPGESLAILRSSRNNQSTVGLISKANFKASDAFDINFGVDWRTAEIEHYREVLDLLGGSYMIRKDSDFWGPEGKRVGLGDKVGYNNTNTVDWFGFFGQGEYSLGRFTAYGMAGYSTIKYTYVDHFADAGDGSELKLESDPTGGYQVKGGAKYSVTEKLDAFGNVGYVSKVPIFDEVIDDVNGVFADNPENEKFTSFELGLNYFAGKFTGKLSYYYTKWADRAIARGITNQDGSEAIIFLSGMNQLHMGVEFEGAYQPINWFRIDLAGSVGRWNYLNDVSGQYKDYDDPNQPTVDYNFYLKDLKVGDAPQTQIAIAPSLYPVRGLFLQAVYRYYAQHYSDFNPLDRDDPTDRTQSWKAPNYGVLDFHASYKLPISLGPVDLSLFGHVFNVLDEIYVQDAVDNSQYNGFSDTHKASDAEVYLGLPRSFNIGLQFSY